MDEIPVDPAGILAGANAEIIEKPAAEGFVKLSGSLGISGGSQNLHQHLAGGFGVRLRSQPPAANFRGFLGALLLHEKLGSFPGCLQEQVLEMGADGNHPTVGALPEEEFSPVQLQSLQQILQAASLRILNQSFKLLIVSLNGNLRVPDVASVLAEDAFPTGAVIELIQLAPGSVQQDPQGVFRVGDLSGVSPEQVNELILRHRMTPVADEKRQQSEDTPGTGSRFPQEGISKLQGKFAQHGDFNGIHNIIPFKRILF